MRAMEISGPTEGTNDNSSESEILFESEEKNIQATNYIEIIVYQIHLLYT